MYILSKLCQRYWHVFNPNIVTFVKSTLTLDFIHSYLSPFEIQLRTLDDILDLKTSKFSKRSREKACRIPHSNGTNCFFLAHSLCIAEHVLPNQPWYLKGATLGSNSLPCHLWISGLATHGGRYLIAFRLRKLICLKLVDGSILELEKLQHFNIGCVRPDIWIRYLNQRQSCF